MKIEKYIQEQYSNINLGYERLHRNIVNNIEHAELYLYFDDGLTIKVSFPYIIDSPQLQHGEKYWVQHHVKIEYYTRDSYEETPKVLLFTTEHIDNYYSKNFTDIYLDEKNEKEKTNIYRTLMTVILKITTSILENHKNMR